MIFDLNIIETLSSYRAVNTRRLGSKQQSVKEVWRNIINNSDLSIVRGPGSSVGTATGYRLDGPGIESRWV